MFRFSKSTLLATAVAISALVAGPAAMPASAQVSISIGFNDFHSRLAPYGNWSHHARWGEVWQPTRVGRNFQPYSDGYWANTREYGWLWISNESWGDVPYHYGRWVSDPRDGWLWVPGYVWGPSWVVWRSGGGNIGWFPMPPGDNYYGNGAYNDGYNNRYGYNDWYGSSFTNDQFLSLWIFVGQDHIGDRNYRQYAIPQREYGGFISRTTNTTNYITVNNYVVNRSVDTTRFDRNARTSYQPVDANTVIGPNAKVTRADEGRRVELRERRARPLPVNVNQTDQNVQGLGNNRNPANGAGEVNPQREQNPPAANEQRPNANQAPQGNRERRNNRNDRSDNTDQAAPRTQVQATPAPIPTENDRSGANRQRIREPAQERGAREQNQNAAVQTPQARSQDRPNAPADDNAAGAQNDARNNQARDNNQDDNRNADDQRASDEQRVADEKKRADDRRANSGRRRN